MAPSRALLSLPKNLRLKSPSPYAHKPQVWCNRTFTTSHILDAESGSEPRPPDYLSEGELKIFNKIISQLRPSSLEVQDISGGCGSMYALDIVSEKFKGLPVIKQHRLVNEVLGEEIKSWHGVQLKTRAG